MQLRRNDSRLDQIAAASIEQVPVKRSKGRSATAKSTRRVASAQTQMRTTTTHRTSERAHFRIMLATDGSPGAAVAFDTVVGLALRPSDEVIVVSYPAYLLAARPGGGGVVAKLMESQAKKAEEVVSTSVAALSAAQGASVRGFVVRGLEAVDAIVQAALDTMADMIVVGSRGRRLVATLVLGSTARTLAMLTPVPVLIARRRELRSVLVAYDGSDAARAAVGLVRRLPLPKGATLTLATVLPVHDWSDSASDETELGQLRTRVERDDAAHAARLLEDATAELVERRPSQVLVESGPVAEAILRRATEMDVDLVVLGSRGVSGPRRPFWGSTAEHLATAARCSVLIVPVPGEEDRKREKPSAEKPSPARGRPTR